MALCKALKHSIYDIISLIIDFYIPKLLFIILSISVIYIYFSLFLIELLFKQFSEK